MSSIQTPGTDGVLLRGALWVLRSMEKHVQSMLRPLNTWTLLPPRIQQSLLRCVLFSNVRALFTLGNQALLS